MKYVLTIIIVVSLLGCASSPTSPGEKRNQAYNDILNEIINNTRCRNCSDPDDFFKKKYNEIIAGKIDSATYFNSLDSIKSVEGEQKKCLLEYSENLHIFYFDDGRVDSTMKVSIKRNLKDVFEDFNGASIASIADTLSVKAHLHPSDLSISCAEIVPYVQNPEEPYRNGIGVLGFSKAYFNQTGDKAVVYYEFMCGRKCGKGEVLFAKKVNRRWVIEKYIRIWDS